MKMNYSYFTKGRESKGAGRRREKRVVNSYRYMGIEMKHFFFLLSKALKATQKAFIFQISWALNSFLPPRETRKKRKKILPPFFIKASILLAFHICSILLQGCSVPLSHCARARVSRGLRAIKRGKNSRDCGVAVAEAGWR